MSLLGLVLPLFAHAASTSITGTTPGPKPFISNVTATYAGGTIASISYQISPKQGSFTRPLSASYSAQYLTSTGALQAGSVTIPVFGLYAAFTNTVTITFAFTDGSQSVQTTNITTASYTDPCVQLNEGTLTQQRVATNDLGFDFFLLKSTCSNNAPTLIDTDGNIRWVGPDGTDRGSVAIYDNALYESDNASGIARIDLTNLAVTEVGDYAAAPYNVTFTDHHNIDPGRNGLIVDVNTTTETEAVDLEFNPRTGAVLNYWDLGQIISYTMTQGGDDPSNFVFGTTKDWFHNNAVAYNPADNTLIVSSRENFVIAVDYDTPLDGQKKIHWILGDTSKAWYQFPSLRAFMLMPTNATTLAPIGQHAVSIDHSGNLLLFDDGYQSLNQVPTGISRTYSAVREYVLNIPARTVTAGSVYYSPTPTIYNDICGSVYDVNGTYLVDFPTANARTDVYLQGLNSSEHLVFSLHYPEQAFCNTGWNAYPLSSNLFTFTSIFGIAANPTTLPVVAGQSGQVAVTVTPEEGFTGSVSFAVAGLPAGISYSFSNLSANMISTLNLQVPEGTPAGTYPFIITGTSGSLTSSATVNLVVQAQPASGFGAASNVYSSFNPGASVTNGGFDKNGYAYAADLLGSSLTFNGVNYTFGAPGTANAVSSSTIAVPAGVYSALNFVGAAVNGNQPSQTFIVTYTDGTTSTFTQSISDWATPQRYPGESIVLSMPYRIASDGSEQTKFSPFYVYAYSLPVNPAKTVRSLTLPNNRDVVVLALTPVSASAANDFGAAANVYSSFNPGSPVTNGGFDRDSFAYSAALLGSSLTFNGVNYTFGAPGTANAVSSSTIAVPAGVYSSLNFLGAAVNGNQPSQTFIVTYTDGTTSTFTQSMSDWVTPQRYAGESIALSMPYRIASDGSEQTKFSPFYVYAYSLPVNPAKTVRSLTLPNNRNVVLLALTPVSASGFGAIANVYSSFNPGSSVTNGGFDRDGFAYSAALLGSSLTFNAVNYTFGAPGTANAVSSSTINVPTGVYSTLNFLGAAVNGNQPSQTFIVTYTDGTTSTFTQSMSDWVTPQRYAGESVALSMPYRIASDGSEQTKFSPFYVYAYSLPVNPAKTVRSLTLPNNRDVVLLALTPN